MYLRTITDHVTNPANDIIIVTATDEPDAGGANHLYSIDGLDPNHRWHCGLKFQQGPIAEAGVNGITQEVLLAVVIDRLRSFQAGPYACRENAIALTKTEEAMFWLQKRTLDRMRRGVEGTSAK